MKRIIALAYLVAMPSFASAEFAPLVDKSTFMNVVEGRTLSNRLYGVDISVRPNGTISGAAWGWEITGSWSWQDGYFCREMNWGGDPIPYNCQLVELRGSDELRFTVDRGKGQSARFRVR